PGDAGPGAVAEADAPADLVGLKWTGDPEAEFVIEVRRSGSHRWEEAATLGGDDLGADEGSADARAAYAARDGANVYEPVWVEGSADVRVPVVGGTVDAVSVQAVTVEGGRAPSGSAGAFGALTPVSADIGFAPALVVAG